MLSQDHPFFAAIVRMRYKAAVEEPEDMELAARARQELADLLVRLENGMFERLPQYVIDAVFTYRETLTHSLDPIILEMAQYVARGKSIPTPLKSSWDLRLKAFHGALHRVFGRDLTPYLPPR
jgi:hypothetical protein